MRKAFTLIELLVVIAVISVLAGLLFPVLAKARERARSTHCVNNMRQIHAATNVYLADWDQHYPYALDTSGAYYNPGASIPAWYVVLAPYLSGKDLLRCPSDVGEVHPGQRYVFGAGLPPFWILMSTSYNYTGLWGGIPSLAGYDTAKVVDPTERWLVGECRPWHDSPSKQMPFDRDPARMNILYCDGHAGRLNWHQWEYVRDWRPIPQ